MALQLLLSPGRNNQIGDLRRQETAQPAHALDLTDLIGNALFELLIQLVEIIEQPRILDSDGRLVSEGLNHALEIIFKPCASYALSHEAFRS